MYFGSLKENKNCYKTQCRFTLFESTNESKKGEIGKIFLKRRLDVCAIGETKLKGKGEVMFGEAVGMVSGV